MSGRRLRKRPAAAETGRDDLRGICFSVRPVPVVGDEVVFIIGREGQYTELFPHVSDVYLTVVDAVLDGGSPLVGCEATGTCTSSKLMSIPPELIRSMGGTRRIYHITRDSTPRE